MWNTLRTLLRLTSKYLDVQTAGRDRENIRFSEALGPVHAVVSDQCMYQFWSPESLYSPSC